MPLEISADRKKQGTMTDLADNWKSGTHKILVPPAPGTWQTEDGLNHISGMFSLRPREGKWALTATCTGLLCAMFSTQAFAMAAVEDLLRLGDWRTMREIKRIGKAAARKVVEKYGGTLACRERES